MDLEIIKENSDRILDNSIFQFAFFGSWSAEAGRHWQGARSPGCNGSRRYLLLLAAVPKGPVGPTDLCGLKTDMAKNRWVPMEIPTHSILILLIFAIGSEGYRVLTSTHIHSQECLPDSHFEKY